MKRDAPRWLRRVYYRVGSVWCGIATGYPQCCVAFFHLYWVRMRNREAYLRWTHTQYQENDKAVPFYIPCPVCVGDLRTVTPRSCNRVCFYPQHRRRKE